VQSAQCRKAHRKYSDVDQCNSEITREKSVKDNLMPVSYLLLFSAYWSSRSSSSWCRGHWRRSGVGSECATKLGRQVDVSRPERLEIVQEHLDLGNIILYGIWLISGVQGRFRCKVQAIWCLKYLFLDLGLREHIGVEILLVMQPVQHVMH